VCQIIAAHSESGLKPVVTVPLSYSQRQSASLAIGTAARTYPPSHSGRVAKGLVSPLGRGFFKTNAAHRLSAWLTDQHRGSLCIPPPPHCDGIVTELLSPLAPAWVLQVHRCYPQSFERMT
ncbi:hypothetical protein BaRGS_00015524, partial [Batillaria attramentaria]